MYIGYYLSKVGLIEIQATDSSISSIQFVDNKTHLERNNTVIQNTKESLQTYFEGNSVGFDLPISLEGTAFQKMVWNELLNIPYGQTVSYKDLAIKLGNENAIRAVANAVGQNKILIIIPCHRVIGSNGKLIGYKAGVKIKKQLLALERENKKSLHK